MIFGMTKRLTHKIEAAVEADLKRNKAGKYLTFQLLNLWANVSAIVLFGMILSYILIAFLLQIKGIAFPPEFTQAMANVILCAAGSYVLSSLGRNVLFTELENYIQTQWNIQHR